MEMGTDSRRRDVVDERQHRIAGIGVLGQFTESLTDIAPRLAVRVHVAV